MRRYKVKMQQTFVHTVEVEADDEEEAINLAEEKVADHDVDVETDEEEIDTALSYATLIEDDEDGEDGEEVSEKTETASDHG